MSYRLNYCNQRGSLSDMSGEDVFGGQTVVISHHAREPESG